MRTFTVTDVPSGPAGIVASPEPVRKSAPGVAGTTPGPALTAAVAQLTVVALADAPLRVIVNGITLVPEVPSVTEPLLTESVTGRTGEHEVAPADEVVPGPHSICVVAPASGT